MALTKEEIIVGNRLIHCFMFPQIKNDVKAMPDWWVEDFCRYSWQWNELMQVVEKIEDNLVSFVIDGDQCVLCDADTGYEYDDTCDSKIESVWRACLDWIKWYNENIIK